MGRRRGVSITMLPLGHATAGAVFSDCQRYRYQLWRRWREGGRRLVFIGLNPSTATHERDDPTVRRCIRFAKRDRFAAMVMLNIYAWRSTDPAKLLHTPDPVGPDNDATIFAHL